MVCVYVKTAGHRKKNGQFSSMRNKCQCSPFPIFVLLQRVQKYFSWMESWLCKKKIILSPSSYSPCFLLTFFLSSLCIFPTGYSELREIIRQIKSPNHIMARDIGTSKSPKRLIWHFLDGLWGKLYALKKEKLKLTTICQFLCLAP